MQESHCEYPIARGAFPQVRNSVTSPAGDSVERVGRIANSPYRFHQFLGSRQVAQQPEAAEQSPYFYNRT
jgi:hypothetical protein